MAGEAARLSNLCDEVSHHHTATRGNRQQGEAALTDHQSCLNRPAAGAASSGILARTSFKRSEIRVQRGCGCWAGPRCILIQNPLPLDESLVLNKYTSRSRPTT